MLVDPARAAAAFRGTQGHWTLLGLGIFLLVIAIAGFRDARGKR